MLFWIKWLDAETSNALFLAPISSDLCTELHGGGPLTGEGRMASPAVAQTSSGCLCWGSCPGMWGSEGELVERTVLCPYSAEVQTE